MKYRICEPFQELERLILRYGEMEESLYRQKVLWYTDKYGTGCFGLFPKNLQLNKSRVGVCALSVGCTGS